MIKQFAKPAAGVIAALVFVGCTKPPAGGSTEASRAPTLRVRYSFQEGSAYGYTSELSENDRKSGVKVGKISIFTFYGVDTAGIYTLGSPDRATFSAVCSNPCRYITVMDDGEIVDRVPFDERTVIGGAFEDAFNGHLKAIPSPASIAAANLAAYEGAQRAEKRARDAAEKKKRAAILARIIATDPPPISMADYEASKKSGGAVDSADQGPAPDKPD